jgi:hypothetical protein
MIEFARISQQMADVAPVAVLTAELADLNRYMCSRDQQFLDGEERRKVSWDTTGIGVVVASEQRGHVVTISLTKLTQPAGIDMSIEPSFFAKLARLHLYFLETTNHVITKSPVIYTHNWIGHKCRTVEIHGRPPLD